MKNFLLIDDHHIIRSGIRSLLTNSYAPCEVFEAESGDEARALLEQHPYDLIILDINMPGSDSYSLTQFIKNNFPDSPVLVLSMNPETIYAKRFIQAGARGFISKSADVNELKKAITQCLHNRPFFSAAVAEQLLSEKLEGNPGGNPFEKLSAREFQLAELIITGRPLTDIAASLGLAFSTASTYKKRIFEKLGVKSSLELAELKKIV